MKRPPRSYAAQLASEAVAAALAHHGITEQIRANRVDTEWTELVGAKIAQRTRPAGITDRTLWIEVATTAWLHELNLLRSQLLERLHNRLGAPVLFDELKFRLAGRSRREPVSRPPARSAPVPVPARPAPSPATGAARERIVREAAAVDDDELRELIARIRIDHDR